MGQALGRLLRDRGEAVVAVGSRSVEQARRAAQFVGGGMAAVGYFDIPRYGSRVLVAVPDDGIGEVARVLAAGGMRSGIALHTSGARGQEALYALAEVGVACGSWHPLQTAASPEEGVRVLPGVAFAIDGAPAAVAWAEALTALLGGMVLRIPAAARPLYHAAATISSNYLIALMATAVILMEAAGVEESSARRALEPLARASMENAFRLGPVDALTGPIARGDVGTVRAHVEALRTAAASTESLYCAAGLATLEIARQKGLAETAASAIEEVLRRGKESD